jgi:hypothetical protein
MQPLPTLKPRHFKGLKTKMLNGGLHFAVRFTPEDRNAECPNMSDTFEDLDDRLNKLAARRGPGQVVLNPRRPSISTIRELCRASQAKVRTRELINVEHGLLQRFDRRWKAKIASEIGKIESQHLVLVAFDEHRTFVGYSGLTAIFTTPLDRTRTYILKFSMELVYVLPERRGSGFGLDLSIATGMVCQDILSACYRAVPAGSSVCPKIYAEYQSEGGESFTSQVKDQLNFTVDVLTEDRIRPSVWLDYVEADGDY